MPYIKQDERKHLDDKINDIILLIKDLPVELQDGSLNYVFTRIIKNIYPLKYYHLNRALGVLSAVSLELYRVVIGPYEDTKIKENGEVI